MSEYVPDWRHRRRVEKQNRERIAKQNASDARLRRAAESARYFQGDEQWLIEELVEREYMTPKNEIETRREWLPLRIWGGMTVQAALRKMRQCHRNRVKRSRDVRLRLRNITTGQIVMGSASGITTGG